MNDILLPLSKDNLEILYYLWSINFSIFFAFNSILFSSFLFSFVYRIFSNANENYLDYLKFYSDVWGKYRNYLFGLAIIPAIANLLFYETFTGFEKNNRVEILIIGTIIYLLSLVFSIIYYNKFLVFYAIKKSNQSLGEELNLLLEENEKLYPKYLIRSFFLLLISIFIFSYYFYFALERQSVKDESIISSLFSIKALLIFFGMIFLFLFFGSASLLTFGILKKDAYHEDLLDGIIKTSYRALIPSAFFVPIFIVLNFAILDKLNYSYESAIWSIVGIIAFFFAAQYLYAFWREKNTNFLFANYAFLAVLTLSFVNQNVFSFKIANKETELLYQKHYAEAKQELIAQLGLGETKISGEDIYKSKCSACHAFDKIIVGPAYKDVLPKYGDDLNKLSAFILNPVKINPQFPPMPNQGLKPSEAKAVAEYLIQKYSAN